MSNEAQEPLTPQAALDQKYMKLALEQAELAAQDRRSTYRCSCSVRWRGYCVHIIAVR